MMKKIINNIIYYLPLILFVLIWIVRGFSGHYVPVAYNSDIMDYEAEGSVISNLLYGLVFIVFICYSFAAKFKSNGLNFIFITSIIIGILYFAEGIIVHDEHFFPLSRAALNPLYLLIFPTAFVAYDKRGVESLLKIIICISLLFVVLGIYVFITDVNGVIVRGHTPILQFRTGAFWGFVFYMSFKPQISKIDYVILLLGLIWCTLISFIIASRSWCIQGILSLLILHFIAFKTDNTKKLSFFAIGLFCICVVPNLYDLFFDSVWYDMFINKLEQDTRSMQYVEVFKQMPLSYFIFGNGFSTSWIQDSVEYRYIDNQTIMFLYRYGLLPTITYYIFILTPVVRILMKHEKANYRNLIFIFMWVMAINGLAVFNTLNWDWSNYLVAFASAHMWNMSKPSIVYE